MPSLPCSDLTTPTSTSQSRAGSLSLKHTMRRDVQGAKVQNGRSDQAPAGSFGTHSNVKLQQCGFVPVKMKKG